MVASFSFWNVVIRGGRVVVAVLIVIDILVVVASLTVVSS